MGRWVSPHDFVLYKIYLVGLRSVIAVYKLPLASIHKQCKVLRCIETVAPSVEVKGESSWVCSPSEFVNIAFQPQVRHTTIVLVHLKVSHCLTVDVNSNIYNIHTHQSNKTPFIKGKILRAPSMIKNEQYLKIWRSVLECRVEQP